ncbi:RteC domain-containing protein [Tenacibaculum mesophilum]|uniref:RteC domain-containing protein n=1 Tax=Tenacibaculum mesophilum TaxID=104268 RepID=UPI0024902BE2|nr:RteC domain-containing protein [Tenacibaculum mesophilum]
MKKKIKRLIEEFTAKINYIEQNNLNNFSNVERGIKISRKYLQELRVVVRNNEFKSIEDEINFFKNQKPFIYARLKFYAKIYNYLLEKPAGSIKTQRNFIDSQLKKLQDNYKKNLDFVKYYREKDNTLDHYYFVRGNDNLSLVSDTSHFYTDAEFSTSHDNSMAKIMAYDLLVNFYNQELVKLGAVNKEVKSNCDKIKLEWTASKTDLIELIYALQSTGAIRDGKVGIKEMATACEQLFNIDLGNYYKTYIEIKARKTGRTNFINKLKKHLENKMLNEEGIN